MFSKNLALFSAAFSLVQSLPHAGLQDPGTPSQATCIDSLIGMPQVLPYTALCTDKPTMHSTIETFCLESEVQSALVALESLCAGRSARSSTTHSMSVQKRDLLSEPLDLGSLSESTAEPKTTAKPSSPLDEIASAADPAPVVQGVVSGIKTAPAALKSLESDVESAPLVGDVVSKVRPAIDGIATAIPKAPQELGGIVSGAANAPKALGGIVSAVADAPKDLGNVVGNIIGSTSSPTQHKHEVSSLSHPTASPTQSWRLGHAVPSSALSRFTAPLSTGILITAPLVTATGIPSVPTNGTIVKPTLTPRPTTVIVHDGGRVTVTAAGPMATAAGSNIQAPVVGAAVAAVAGLAMLL